MAKSQGGGAVGTVLEVIVAIVAGLLLLRFLPSLMNGLSGAVGGALGSVAGVNGGTGYGQSTGTLPFGFQYKKGGATVSTSGDIATILKQILAGQKKQTLANKPTMSLGGGPAGGMAPQTFYSNSSGLQNMTALQNLANWGNQQFANDYANNSVPVDNAALDNYAFDYTPLQSLDMSSFSQPLDTTSYAPYDLSSIDTSTVDTSGNSGLDTSSIDPGSYSTVDASSMGG